ncbi:MAG: type I-G CRISPR-associated protein Csb2, partial [Terriglobales bacterium]
MLTLHIRYLTGRVWAAEASDREQVEWPPHPARVFMALAAAHFETGGDAAERGALEWLESLPAPRIHAGEPFPRHAVTQFVPVGDVAIEGTAPLQSPRGWPRNRQPRTFASAALEDECAALYWPEAEAGGHFAALAALCAKVTRIGHSISLVQVWAAQSPPGRDASYVPAEEPSVMLRVPGAGLLAELERGYNGAAVERWGELKAAAETNGGTKKELAAAKKALSTEFPDGEPRRQRPMVSLYAGYAAPADQAQPGAVGTVWTPAPLLYALERESGSVRALDIVATLQLTARLRDALLLHLGPGSPEALSGHKGEGPAEAPHLAIFPLPFVGREHADGHLLGVGLALPRGLSPAERRQLLAGLHQVSSEGLKLGPLGVWRLRPADSGVPRRALLPEPWTAMPKGAVRWATVTPYVCDRHSKAKDAKEYFAEMAEEIGAAWRRVSAGAGDAESAAGGEAGTADVHVETVAVSAHLGVPPAHQFPRLRRKDGSERRQTHAILTFSRPVVGPLLLGAGRFRGYGLCRPLLGPAQADDGAEDG